MPQNQLKNSMPPITVASTSQTNFQLSSQPDPVDIQLMERLKKLKTDNISGKNYSVKNVF